MAKRSRSAFNHQGTSKRARNAAPKLKKLASDHSASSDLATKSEIPPLRTLYLRNLTTDLPISDLRTSLYLLASLYGPVVAVNAHKSPKMRGQAHIAFDTAQTAMLAHQGLHQHPFFGRNIHCEFAHQESQRSEWQLLRPQ